MRRTGGWVLVLLAIGAMAGGGWFALRRAVKREAATVVFLRCGRDPTDKAMARGGEFALQEAEGRAGRFSVALVQAPLAGSASGDVWIGTSGALLQQGDVQPHPFFISVVDTHPLDAAGRFRISPGCDQQGSSAARWARKSGLSRVFLLRDSPSLRSKAIAAGFETAAGALGITVEGPAEAAPENVDRILASKADLVFYSGEEAPYGTTAKIFAALREKGFSGRMVAAEADPEVSFLATRPGLVDGTYLVSPFAPAPPELAARMGFVPGPHVTAGYFAMKAMLDAIDRASSIGEDALHRAAASLPYFDDQGRAALRRCALYVARDGRFEFVELLE